MGSGDHAKKPETRNSIVTPSSDYADNCKSGFNRLGFSNAHHILASTCMAARRDSYPTDPKTRQYIEDCLYCAVWDLNAGENLIGLPTNNQFKDSDGVVTPEVPSHQCDHIGLKGYIKEVTKWLKDNLWDTLQAKGDIHQVDVTTVQNGLEGCSNFYRGLLEDMHPKRPFPLGGIKVSWDNRYDPVKGKRWYEPFSMSSTPSPRHPGAKNRDLTGIFKKLI
jgi:hypothetical protein